MTSPSDPPGSEKALRHARDAARGDLELFLTELRVSLSGAQILFAFLLSLPFTSQFGQVSRLQRHVYFAGFLCCATATLLLIAPSVYHRVHWRSEEGHPSSLLVAFNRLAAIGAGFLAMGMACVVFVVSSFLFGSAVGAVLGAIAVGGFVWFWFGLPSVHRSRARRSGAERAPPQ